MFRKCSLKVKLSLILIAMVLIILFVSIFLSNTFSMRYYLYDKEQSLISTFETIDEVYESELENDPEGQSGYGSGMLSGFLSSGIDVRQITGGSISDDLSLTLDQLSQNSNMSVIIYRDIYTSLYDMRAQKSTPLLLYSSLGNDAQDSLETNNIYTDYMSAEKSDDSSEVVTESYSIDVLDVKRLGSSYIYLEGNFSNDDHILIRASVAGINESVMLSTRFFLYISVIAALVGFVVMLFVSNRFLSPITLLTGIAQRMSDLDFTAKYEGKTEDEVGMLGHSMNVLSETLEETLSELKSANAELKKDLENREAVDEMRKEFLANVSHELKTPIALIEGYAEGLVDNVNEDEESRRFYCDVIMDEARKMNSMVKNLMDLNQLEFGYNNINMEHFDVVGLIRAIISKSDVLQKQNDAVVVFDEYEPVYVWSDAYMTEEIFTNYLTNAFNHVSGEKRIEIGIIKKESTVRITVFNTGDPIPEDETEKIWDKFYKVDKARSREYGGSGVGLSIVKASMEELGQSYGVENKDNGVLFWFELDCENKVEGHPQMP